MPYQVTIDNGYGVDTVTFYTPAAAVETIQLARTEGWDVEYTGDPFADVARMIEEV